MVNEINRTGAVGSNYLRIGQNLDNSEYYSAPDASIIGVTHDTLIVANQGVDIIIKGNVSQGTSLIYSVSPALPAGLTLDALTDNISGKPTALSSRKSYVVTATNLLDKSFYTFDLEVRDHFTFSESSGAKSFLTHKTGSNRTSRACKINATDILNGTNSSALDIGCELEAEELELFYTKLKMKAMVGGGVCEYVGFRPFSFWQYAPEKTTRTINSVSGCTGGTAPGGAVNYIPTAVNSCYGNYTDEGGPNSDTGTVTVNTYTASTAGNPCDTVAQTTINCGGTKIACLAGPITSVITDSAALANGFRVSTIFSAEGLEKTWDIRSSLEFLDVTNLRNANGVVLNACSNTRANANTWASQTQAATVAPHGGGENPFYEFTCLDAAKDIKARIRLVVREWNRTFRINDLINDVLPVKMNTNAVDPLFGSTYNQIQDWDNVYSQAGVAALPSCGTNVTASCSDITYTTPTTCEKNGAIWTTDGFQFPKGEI